MEATSPQCEKWLILVAIVLFTDAGQWEMGMEELVLRIEFYEPAPKGLCWASDFVLVSVPHL